MRLPDTAGTPLMIDIVVPVHNALPEVQACLRALARVPTGVASRVIVVNDASDGPTTAWLREAAATLGTGSVRFELIEQAENAGYTRTANAGLRASEAAVVVVLNSDTVVTPYWLDALLRCLASHPRMGIVGPLSNAANWQSVPDLRDEDGRFAINGLPPGLTPTTMAALVAAASARSYPRLPFINGFCYMIGREVIDRIGLFDEEAFPVGYGEENDYAIRALDAGFLLAVADDAYVFHAKSRSFGHERRAELTTAGLEAIARKHPPERLDELRRKAKKDKAMEAVRSRVGAELARFGEGMARIEAEGLVDDPATVIGLVLERLQYAEGLRAAQVIDLTKERNSLSSELARESAALRERAAAAEAMVARLTKRLEAAKSANAELRKRLAETEAKQRSTLAELAEQRRAAKDAEAARRALQRSQERLLASRSWRMTAPFRALGSRLKGG